MGFPMLSRYIVLDIRPVIGYFFGAIINRSANKVTNDLSAWPSGG